MPAYRLSDPRHPQNKIRLLWRAWEDQGWIGEAIPVSKVKSHISAIMGVTNDRAIKDYMETMASLQVVEWDKGESMTPREDGIKVLEL